MDAPNGVPHPRKRRRRRRLDRPAVSARLLLDDGVKGEVGLLSEDLFTDLFPGSRATGMWRDRSISRDFADTSSNQRRRIGIRSHSARRNHAVATERRRGFPDGAMDHSARPNRGERRLVYSAPTLVAPDSGIVACATVLLPHSPHSRAEPNPAERHADRSSHTPCCANRPGYSLCQPGHGNAEKAGSSACQVWRRLRGQMDWRSQGTQEPPSRREWDKRKSR
jgi:hypothetical protein